MISVGVSIFIGFTQMESRAYPPEKLKNDNNDTEGQCTLIRSCDQHPRCKQDGIIGEEVKFVKIPFFTSSSKNATQKFVFYQKREQRP